MSIQNWGIVLNQFLDIFEKRVPLKTTIPRFFIYTLFETVSSVKFKGFSKLNLWHLMLLLMILQTQCD